MVCVESHAPWADLREALEHCATRVPLYRGIAAPEHAPSDPREVALRALDRFPILTKERLRRAFPQELVPADRKLGEALRSGEVTFVGTSGTTGERVQVLWHQAWWDAQERDGFEPHSLAARLVNETGYREAVLTTPVCSGNLCHVGQVPMEDRIVDGRTLFLNQTVDPAHWTDADVLRIADELERFRPAAIEADPAYLAFFAARLARLGRAPFRPEFIDLSYELPSLRHIATIRRLFGCPVLDAYGSTECGFVFMEGDCGRLHPNLRWSFAELKPVARRPGLEGLGVLLVTTLRNPWLNLVRLDTGDLVRPAAAPCPCGRDEGLSLESVEGRVKDCLVIGAGRVLTPRDVDRALAGVRGLLHYRVVQRAANDIELDLVADGLDPLDAKAAADALGALVGASPRARVVPSVPTEASGKFRLCHATHVGTETLLQPG